MTEFLSINEFLDTYRLSRATLYRTLRDKNSKLRITKIGRASRIAKADAQSWAASLPTIGGGAS